MKRKTTLILVTGLGLGAILAVLALLSVGVRALATAPHAEPPVVRAEVASPQSSGGVSKGGAFLISTAAYARENPVIAYNSISDTYLIVWADGESDRRDVYGQIYSAQGVPQGEVFPIAIADDDQYRPAIAYNVALNQYLVVWRDERTHLWGGHIYGQRIGVDGNLLDNPGTPDDESDPGVNFPISLVYDRMTDPAVASNGVDEYLVVWDDMRVGHGQIYGQRVGADGSLLDNPGTPGDESDPDVDFLISEETVTSGDPAIAYSADAGEYLVVWQRGSSYMNIYGRRVLANGSPQGDVFSISVANRRQQEASVAYSADSREYLVVWQEDYVAESWRLDNEINGQRVGIDGSLLDNPGTSDIDESDPAVSFPICSGEGFQGYPDLAYITDTSAALGQYLVVWQDERHDSSSGIDIYAQRVGGDGTLAEQGDFAVSSAIGDQELPAVAYSSGSHQYLAVWQDDRQGVVNHIYGQRVWWPGLPLGHNFALGAPSADQERPAIAYNSEDREYLVVWSDERNGDADIYGQFYDRDGVPLGEIYVVYEGTHAQTRPAAAYNAIDNDYLVVWQDDTLGNDLIGGRVISSVQGSPLGPVFELSYPTGSYSDPAVAHNASLAHNDYLVVFEQVGGTGVDIRGWQVSAEGTPAGGAFTICDDSHSQWDPDVVYTPVEDEFLVAWEDDRAGDYDIYARRVSAAGSLTGGEIVIANAVQDQEHPAVVYNSEDNEYLIVWDDDRVDGIGDIYAQRVLTTGVLAGGNITVPVTSPSTGQRYPDAVYVSSLDRYRIVWQDNRDSATLGWDIRGQWLAADGSYVGTLDSPIFRYPGDQEYPAIAYAPGQERALVIWQDGRSGSDFDIYGRFGALDLNPPVARFTRNPGVFRPVGIPFAFNAWPSIDDTTPRGSLEVRWDLDGDGSWDDASFSYNKYVTHTFSTPGLHTVTLQVRDEALLTDSISLPVFAYASALRSAGVAAASVPTASLAISPTFHVAGDAFTFDGSGSTGGGALLARWDWENDGLFDTGYGAVLTATHIYTVAGDYTVRLEVRDTVSGLSDADLHNVTVQAGDPISLEVAPDEAAVVGADLFRFRATGWDSYDNKMYNPAVTWTVAASQAGAIGASGVFTAGVQAGTYADAIVVGNGVLTETASVTVYWPHQVYLPLVVRNY